MERKLNLFLAVGHMTPHRAFKSLLEYMFLRLAETQELGSNKTRLKPPKPKAGEGVYIPPRSGSKRIRGEHPPH